MADEVTVSALLCCCKRKRWFGKDYYALGRGISFIPCRCSSGPHRENRKERKKKKEKVQEGRVAPVGWLSCGAMHYTEYPTPSLALSAVRRTPSLLLSVLTEQGPEPRCLL